MEDKFSKILSVKFENYKCFEDFTLDCRKPDGKPYQWTVLLGDNNTGKTNILRAIAGLIPIQRPALHRGKTFKYLPKGMYQEQNSRTNDITKITCVLLKALHFFWDYHYSNDGFKSCRITDNEQILNLKLLGYGVTRYPSSTSLSQNDCEDCETLFNTSKRLTNIEEWLMQLDYAGKSKQKRAEKQLEKIKEILCGKVFPEITDFKFVSSEDTLKNYVLFQTKDGWFRYTDLGFGYQSTLAWVVDLCRRMFELYPESEDPLKEGAVVLVDEIDLHLHPKWQREVIGDLSAYFPNIQFIVTTHSPAVVQSMSDVNLYTFSRPEGKDKVIVTRSERRNFSGWTVEEIMRETMGLGEDVHSNIYNKQRQLFDDALDAEDKAKAKEAYEVLDKILHPNNPIRRMLRLQFQSIDSDD